MNLKSIIDKNTLKVGKQFDRLSKEQQDAMLESFPGNEQTKAIVALHRNFPIWQSLIVNPPVGGVIAALKPRGGTIDPRYAYPVSGMALEEINNSWRDYAWVICDPSAPTEDPTGSLDGQYMESEMISGSHTMPQPYLMAPDTSLMHRRQPVDVIGHGLRMLDVKWQAFYTSTVPEYARVSSPAPSFTK